MRKAKDWIKSLFSALDDLLYPEDVLCLCCARALGEDAQMNICPTCAKALERLAVMQRERERTEAPPEIREISSVRAAYPYDAQAKRLIWKLKYESVRSAAQPLASAMAELTHPQAEVIVPVPTDRKRLKKRGFNQASVIAEAIGRKAGIPVVQALERTQSRASQTSLTAEQRRENLVGCMTVCEMVAGKRILLVDDVITTGSTIEEAARALHQAGAAEIHACAAAQAGWNAADATKPEFL